MRRLWQYARAYRGALGASALLFPVAAAVDLVQPYLVKVAIDDHIVRGDWPGLSRVAALFVGTLLVQYVLRYAMGYLVAWTGQRVIHDLREALFGHVQRLPARFFDRTPVGRLMTRILNDVEAIGELFTSGVVAILGDVLTLGGVVVVMLALDWRLALVAFAAVPVLFGVAGYFRTRARDAYREVRNRIARVNAYLQENLIGMTVVQLFGREAAHTTEFARLNEKHRQAVFRRMGYDALLYAGVEVIGSVAIASLIWWGGGEILAGALTFGVLVAFMEYTHRFFLPIRDVSAKYTVMQSAMVAAERIFGLLDTPVEIAAPLQAYRPARDGHRPPAAIEFRDVWFAYAEAEDLRTAGSGRHEPMDARALAGDRRDDWVLCGLTFRIAYGERVAVVGATGAGKSTLARLLTRTYDVQRGAILVDGVDVREWDLGALRRHVGLVLQDVVVFTGTVAENITLGDPGIARTEVEAAARRAHIDAFIRSLPRQYEEGIRERGANLSHGQRQLLAVARALVYNPPVLVLDEATSSVDPDTELLVQDALDRLLSGRTSVVIAHRFSTIQRADRVLVLHRGRLREDGSHAELLRQGGIYAMLYELQFGREIPATGRPR
ncbi:MAG: ABC transporter ATP-binding protein [Candidatus Rokubacteria bacterium]|nr:ABC transporter ATP-binding protein [Candidatus Rokubacteria bacterium]